MPDPHPTPSSGPSLPTLDGQRDAIAAAFEAAGIAGLVLVEATALQAIERSYGVEAHHQVVQRLFERVREELDGTLRESDQLVLGEFGHDEIAVLLFRDEDQERFHREELPGIARRLDRSLGAAGRIAYPFARDPLPVSVGTALVVHDPSLRPDVLIRRGRELAREDAALEARLARRGRREDFVSVLLGENVSTVFEPIVHLASGETHGFEALVRGRGVLASPRALFEAAIEADMLFAFDCLCRRSAFTSARRLPAGAKLFLNCLPSAIHDPALEGHALRHTLDEHPLQPSDVVFEISERESIENFSIFREACDHYRELGFRIALDDVGVGYASLEVVTELAPDYIKVDRAFVRGIDTDPQRREVLVALASISGKLGAHIIAEGIETEPELAVLRELAIDYGQGFLLGRASALDEG